MRLEFNQLPGSYIRDKGKVSSLFFALAVFSHPPWIGDQLIQLVQLGCWERVNCLLVCHRALCCSSLLLCRWSNCCCCRGIRLGPLLCCPPHHQPPCSRGARGAGHLSLLPLLPAHGHGTTDLAPRVSAVRNSSSIIHNRSCCSKSNPGQGGKDGENS